VIPLKFLKFIKQIFLISNVRHVLNVVFFLLGESSASEFYGTQNSDSEESPKERIQSVFVYRDRQVMNSPTYYIGKYCSSVINYKIF